MNKMPKMAKYKVTDPQGVVSYIHAPENVHQDHVLNFAKNALGRKQMATSSVEQQGNTK